MTDSSGVRGSGAGGLAWRAPLWASGQISVQIFRDVPSLLLLFYMTSVLAIPPGMAGVAVFIPKLFWAVFCDFTVGVVSDRTRRWFSRRVYLLAGAALAPVALILLFWPAGEQHAWARALQISLVLAIYMTAFALFSVPHLALGTELTADPRGQSKVMAWRTAFIGVGLFFGAALSPQLIQAGGGGPAGYGLMSWILAAVCGLALISAFFGSGKDVPMSAAAAAMRGPGLWKAILGNRAFVFLVCAYFAQLVGQGCAYATETYLFVYPLRFAAPLQVLSTGVSMTVIGILIAQPFLVGVTTRFGSKRTFQLGTVLYASSLAWMALGPSDTHLSIYLAAFSLGLTASACQQSAYTRLSEIIAAENARSGGQSRAGIYASLFVANDKIAFALGGALLAGLVLAAFGFQPGVDARQSPLAMKGIIFAFAGIPAIFNLLALVLMGFSPDPGARAETVITLADMEARGGAPVV